MPSSKEITLAIKKNISDQNSRFRDSEKEDIIEILNNREEFNYDDFLSDIALDFSAYTLGFIFDEDKLICKIFYEGDDYAEHVNDILDIWNCLDAEAAWSFSVVSCRLKKNTEKDLEFYSEVEYFEIDVLDWYYGTLYENIKDEKLKKDALKLLREKYSKKLDKLN